LKKTHKDLVRTVYKKKDLINRTYDMFSVAKNIYRNYILPLAQSCDISLHFYNL